MRCASLSILFMSKPFGMSLHFLGVDRSFSTSMSLSSPSGSFVFFLEATLAGREDDGELAPRRLAERVAEEPDALGSATCRL